MIAYMLFLFTVLSVAFGSVTRHGDICVTSTTAFSDLGGDNWIQNIDRNAVGFQVDIEDDAGTYTTNLGEAGGCIYGLSVSVHSPNYYFNVVVKSKAVINGVSIESWEGKSDTTHHFAVEHFNDIVANTSFSHTKRITGSDARWRNLLVATRVFRDSNWNIDQGVSRACCLEDSASYGDLGTCPSPSTGGYALITTPVQLQLDLSPPLDKHCCQSRLIDSSDGETYGPGVYVADGSSSKFTIAHEVGHVIVAMRAGGGEQNSSNAYMNDCAGTWADDETTLLPYDDAYGDVTKEYVALALKEGWANFVSAATWNDLTDDYGEFQGPNVDNDWNLDGLIDMNWVWRTGGFPAPSRTVGAVTVPATSLQGLEDIEGLPNPSNISPSYSWTTPSGMDARNWLIDMEAADDDNIDGDQCQADGNADHEENRSTIYDVSRFYWDLATDEALTQDQLSDLHVDMCFRGWSETDASSPSSYTLPLWRLSASAVVHGWNTEVGNAFDNIIP